MGDVIYIEANSGAVKRVGRCDAYATEFDLEAEEYVPLPKVGWPPCVAIFRMHICSAARPDTACLHPASAAGVDFSGALLWCVQPWECTGYERAYGRSAASPDR